MFISFDGRVSKFSRKNVGKIISRLPILYFNSDGTARRAQHITRALAIIHAAIPCRGPVGTYVVLRGKSRSIIFIGR